MQEEKSDAGASDTSSRSSLSNKELSSIAKRALKRSTKKIQSEFDENRRLAESSKTILNDSDQKARQALLNVTKNKKARTIEGKKSNRLNQNALTSVVNTRKEKETVEGRKSVGESDVSGHSVWKASGAAAIENSTKMEANENETSQSGMDIIRTLSMNSIDGSRSRRLDHPAFAGRPGKTNVSSAHILASFRQFNAARRIVPTNKKQGKLLSWVSAHYITCDFTFF